MPKPTDPNKHKFMFSDDMKFVQKVIIFHPTDKSKFLTIKTDPSHPTRANEWDLPGGNVIFGENHMDSLLHEITEETGLEVKDITPIEVFTQMRPEYYLLFIGYTATAVSDNVRLSEEHTEFQWVTSDEFQNLFTRQEFKNMVKKYA